MSILVFYGLAGIIAGLVETVQEEIHWSKKRKEFAARRPKSYYFY